MIKQEQVSNINKGPKKPKEDFCNLKLCQSFGDDDPDSPQFINEYENCDSFSIENYRNSQSKQIMYIKKSDLPQRVDSKGQKIKKGGQFGIQFESMVTVCIYEKTQPVTQVGQYIKDYPQIKKTKTMQKPSNTNVIELISSMKNTQ